MRGAFPQPNGAFRWVQAAAGPMLICEPLAPYVFHGFTTRNWSLGVDTRAAGGADPWGEVAGAIGVRPDALARVRQVHGATVVQANDALGSALEADILINRMPGLGAAVRAADCTPLLAVDVRTGAVAAAHAGWRGMAARVPRALVSAMTREFGTKPGDLLIALGPSIGACCYEVGPDVAASFRSAGFSADRLARWFLPASAPTPRNPSMRHVTSAPRPGHSFFDGWGCVRDQLVDEGVPAAGILAADLCTASHPDVFCSYRRDRETAGRIAAMIRPRESTGH